jgi:hypothetical protein
MSLRDFNNAPFSDDPTALHTAPSGNGAGLDSFHTTQPEDIEPNNLPKIVGAVAVALMVGVAGVALYAHSGNQPKPVVAASNLPPAQPAPAAMTPDANTPPPAAETPPPAAAMTPAEKTPAPVKSASIAKKHVGSSAGKNIASSSSSDASSAAATRMSADSSQSTVQPQQQQAVTQPTAPQPSPSDVATNNTQSGVAVPSGANAASDIPVAPPALQQSPAPANPAPEQSAPAPTQPSGQAAQ